MAKRASVLLAVKRSDLEAVLDKLEEGANVNERDSTRYTALHWACKCGDLSIVELLLERGADPKAVDSYGEWPVFRAIRNGHSEVAQFMLSRYGLPGSTPTHFESRGASGAHSRTRLLDHALRSGDKAMVMLLSQYAMPLHLLNDEGTKQTLLMRYADCSADAAVEVLLSCGVDVHAVDSNGDTALHYAARDGTVPIVSKLLSAGALADSQNELGRTPMWYAVERNAMEIVDILAAFGAAPVSKAKVQTDRYLVLPTWTGEDDEDDEDTESDDELS